MAFMFMFLLGACAAGNANADVVEQTKPLKIWFQNANDKYRTLSVIDEDTGVNYVVVSTYDFCHHQYTIAITPRLNADGTLYVSK